MMMTLAKVFSPQSALPLNSTSKGNSVDLSHAYYIEADEKNFDKRFLMVILVQLMDSDQFGSWYVITAPVFVLWQEQHWKLKWTV